MSISGKMICSGNSQRIIPSAIKTGSFDSAKIANTGQCRCNQTIQKLVHAFSSKGNFGPNGHALTQFEVCHVFLEMVGTAFGP